MTFAYDKAFDLIASRVEEELAKTGFTREKVSSSDPNELVALYTSENVAYSVLYTKDKQQMILRTCAMTADEGPDNDWKTLATWLYDDADATQKDAESIANDFIDGVSGAVAVKRTKQTKSKKKKGDDGNADPKFLAKRFIAVFPELREEIMDEEDYYYPFRGATFAKEHIAPKLPSYIICQGAHRAQASVLHQPRDQQGFGKAREYPQHPVRQRRHRHQSGHHHRAAQQPERFRLRKAQGLF